MLGDVYLRQIEQFLEVAHTKWLLQEQVQNSKTRWVRKGSESFDQIHFWTIIQR